MKKAIAMLLSIVFMVTLLPSSAFAVKWNSAPKVYLSATVDGTKVVATVKLAPYTDLGALEFYLHYDQEALSTTDADVVCMGFLDKVNAAYHVDTNAHCVKISSASGESYSSTEDEDVLTVTFSIIEGKTGVTKLSLSDFALANEGRNLTETPGGTHEAGVFLSVPTVTAAIGDGRVTVSWTVADHGGSAILGYTVQLNGENPIALGADTTSYTFTGLTNGTSYTVKVTALNAAGTSAPGTATATPKAPNIPGPGSGIGSGGTVTEPRTNEDGSVTEIVTDGKTGTVIETTAWPDGTKIVTTTKDGRASSEVTIPAGKASATVTVPTAQKPAPGQVAVIVHADGTKEIVKTSVATAGGMRVTLTAGAKLEIMDNSKTFKDVEGDHWAAAAVQFAASRELFNGTGEGTFSPGTDMTRAMLMTVLARLDGQDTAKGGTWDRVGAAWAEENGVSDGTNLSGSITREQLAVMLYRYAKASKTGADLDKFPDAGQVSAWASEAMGWAVANGILKGDNAGKLNPGSNATRTEVATMLQRFVESFVK